jgi:hypothetical protein
MKNIYFLISTLIITSIGLAQTEEILLKPKDEVVFGVSTFYTKLANRNFYGISLDGRVYASPKWSVGFNISAASKNLSNDFGYYVERPTVNYFEFSLVNSVDLYKTNKFRLGFSIANGYGAAVLTDRAFTEPTGDFFEVPITIATNNFYVLQTGIEAAVRVKQYPHGYDFYIKTDIKNRKTFGNANFGTSPDFNGMYFGVGVLIFAKL